RKAMHLAERALGLAQSAAVLERAGKDEGPSLLQERSVVLRRDGDPKRIDAPQISPIEPNLPEEPRQLTAVDGSALVLAEELQREGEGLIGLSKAAAGCVPPPDCIEAFDLQRGGDDPIPEDRGLLARIGVEGALEEAARRLEVDERGERERCAKIAVQRP